MQESIYFWPLVGLLVAVWVLYRTADLLNVKQVSEKIPDEFDGIYDAESYAKSQRYLRDRTRFDALHATINLVVLFAFWWLGGFAWIYGIAQGASDTLIVQGLAFVGILMGLNMLADLPFSIADTFGIEAKYGFNKTTPKTFVGDFAKNLLITVLLGGPILALVIWFFSSLDHAWLWVWVSVTVIQFALMYIWPTWIMPLFNKFESLPDGDLKQAIMDYADKEKFVLQDIYQMDGSKRSSRSNAFFTGFGKNRRVALFDTLIEKHTVPELVGVLAHEIGHFRLKHIPRMLIANVLMMGAMFFALSLFLGQPELYAAFGVTPPAGDPLPLYAGLIFFSLLFNPLSVLLSLGINAMSRKHEFEADAFAARTTGNAHAMIDALKKLSVDNLSNLTPHRLLVVLSYSHPPMLERIAALRKVAGG